MGNSFKTTCKDYTRDGKLTKGCGKDILIKREKEGEPWHPYNEDGTPHKHGSTTKEVQVVEKTAIKTVVQEPLVPIDQVIRIIAREEAEKVFAEHNQNR